LVAFVACGDGCEFPRVGQGALGHAAGVRVNVGDPPLQILDQDGEPRHQKGGASALTDERLQERP